MALQQRGSADTGAKHHRAELSAAAERDTPIRVGDSVAVAVRLDCEHGCDLSPARLFVEEPQRGRRAVELATNKQGALASLELTAPLTAGTHTWTFVVPEWEDGVAHDGSATNLKLDVVPHVASMAVWSLPDTAVVGQPFTVKVGASSTAGGVLAGQPIEIRDATGGVAGQARLGEQPWQGTTALLWTEVEIAAPDIPGVARWSAHLPTDGLALAHDTAASGFSINVTAQPRHRVEITVVDRATGMPLGDAVVRLGAARASTDPMGWAELSIADGILELLVWKAGYDVPSALVEAGKVAALVIEAIALPDEDPNARWTA